jgi:hypothetical protein
MFELVSYSANVLSSFENFEKQFMLVERSAKEKRKAKEYT